VDGASIALVVTAVGGLATAAVTWYKARTERITAPQTVAMDQVDKALKVLGETIDRQEGTIHRVESENEELRGTVREQADTITRLESTVDRQSRLITRLEGTVERLTARVTELEDHTA